MYSLVPLLSLFVFLVSFFLGSFCTFDSFLCLLWELVVPFVFICFLSLVCLLPLLPVFSQSGSQCGFLVSSCFVLIVTCPVSITFSCLLSRQLDHVQPCFPGVSPLHLFPLYKLSAFPSVSCRDFSYPPRLCACHLLNISQFSFLMSSLVSIFGNSAKKLHFSLVLPVSLHLGSQLWLLHTVTWQLYLYDILFLIA